MIALIATLLLSQALAEQPVDALAVVGGDAPVAAASPDRSAPPAVADPVPLPRPEPTIVALKEGVTLRHARVPGVRKVVVTVRFDQGAIEVNGANDFVAKAVSNLQGEATADYSADALAELADAREIAVSAWLSTHNAGAELEAPLHELDEGMKVLGSVLLRPTFDKKDLKRWVRDQQLYWTKLGPSSNQSVAASLRTWGLYGADHPYGLRPDLASLAKLKPSALQSLHAKVLVASPAVISVVGDLDLDAAKALVAPLAASLGGPAVGPAYPEVPPLAGTRVLAADLPGNPQAFVMLRLMGPSRTHADRVAAEAVDWALGGHFMSRLNANLREEKGFTYGSRSSLALGERAGVWDVSVDVKAENAAATVTEIERELARLASEGPQADEIDMSWREQVALWNDAYSNAMSASELYYPLIQTGETLADERARLDTRRALAPADATAVGAKWLGADQPRLWVIVGDRTVIAPQLDALGWQVTWVDPKDAVLGKL